MSFPDLPIEVATTSKMNAFHRSATTTSYSRLSIFASSQLGQYEYAIQNNQPEMKKYSVIHIWDRLEIITLGLSLMNEGKIKPHFSLFTFCSQVLSDSYFDVIQDLEDLAIKHWIIAEIDSNIARVTSSYGIIHNQAATDLLLMPPELKAPK